MAFVPGNNTLKRICEVLGIDPNKTPIRRITMDFPLNGIAEVLVHRLLKTDELDGVIEVLGDDGISRHVVVEDFRGAVLEDMAPPNYFGYPVKPEFTSQ